MSDLRLSVLPFLSPWDDEKMVPENNAAQRKAAGHDRCGFKTADNRGWKIILSAPPFEIKRARELRRVVEWCANERFRTSSAAAQSACTDIRRRALAAQILAPSAKHCAGNRNRARHPNWRRMPLASAASGAAHPGACPWPGRLERIRIHDGPRRAGLRDRVECRAFESAQLRRDGVAH